MKTQRMKLDYNHLLETIGEVMSNSRSKIARENGTCNSCPLKIVRDSLRKEDTRSCTTILLENAIDLINRQKAEIERLNKENARFADIGKMYSEIRAEVVKEFAERLSNLTASYWLDNINKGHIDDLVKKMTEPVKLEHNSLCETETYKG